MSILLSIGTFVLILISLFMILVVLAQKAKSDGGMGSAMGGGMAEAAFGADTGNVLSKSTINAAVAFFVLTFALYLGRIYERKHAALAAGSALPTISVPAKVLPKVPLTTVPLTTAAPVTGGPLAPGTVPASLARPVTAAPASLPSATTTIPATAPSATTALPDAAAPTKTP